MLPASLCTGTTTDNGRSTDCLREECSHGHGSGDAAGNLTDADKAEDLLQLGGCHRVSRVTPSTPAAPYTCAPHSRAEGAPVTFNIRFQNRTEAGQRLAAALRRYVN